VALPVRVHVCNAVVEHAVLAAVVRVYAALRWQVSHRHIVSLLTSYYAYVVRCTHG